MSSSKPHVYPSSMHEIPFASDLTSPQQKILQDLQREHSEMVEKLELLKRLKTKLINRRITLNAMNRVLQPQRLSERNMYFSKFLKWDDDLEDDQDQNGATTSSIVTGSGSGNGGVIDEMKSGIQTGQAKNAKSAKSKSGGSASIQRKHEQLHAILQQDLDDVMAEQEELQRQYDEMMKRTVEKNSQLRKSKKVLQEMHDQMEALFVHNHSIDNLHARFGLPSNDKSLMMNIGCTHNELLHGLLHIFENWVCFESIVLVDQENSHTNNIIVPVSDIQTISKQGTDGITIKRGDGSRVELFHFRQDKLESVFETLFQARGRKK